MTNATKPKVRVTGPTTTRKGATVARMAEATTRRNMLVVRGITMTMAPRAAGMARATKSKDHPGSTRGRTRTSRRKQTISRSPRGSRTSSTVAARATPRTARNTSSNRVGSTPSIKAVVNRANTKIKMSKRSSRSWRMLPKS